jgi:hypothetical protein
VSVSVSVTECVSECVCVCVQIFAAMVSGTSYAFGIFSEILKDRLGFKQVDVALIGSFGSTGLYMVSE